MLVLVVGPSGVGKSACCEYAAGEIADCTLFDLDVLVRERSGVGAGELLRTRGDEYFLEACRREVAALKAADDGKVALIAVGAGALQSHAALDWLRAPEGVVVSVLAAPQEIYARGGARSANRSFDDFFATEFSDHRQAIYAAAARTIDVTGSSLCEAQRTFTDAIREIAGGA